MTPDVARKRHFTYSSDLLADISVQVSTFKNGEGQASFERAFPSTVIGRIPVMVYSRLCTLSGAFRVSIRRTDFDSSVGFSLS